MFFYRYNPPPCVRTCSFSLASVPISISIHATDPLSIPALPTKVSVTTSYFIHNCLESRKFLQYLTLFSPSSPHSPFRKLISIVGNLLAIPVPQTTVLVPQAAILVPQTALLVPQTHTSAAHSTTGSTVSCHNLRCLVSSPSIILFEIPEDKTTLAPDG